MASHESDYWAKSEFYRDGRLHCQVGCKCGATFVGEGGEMDIRVVRQEIERQLLEHVQVNPDPEFPYTYEGRPCRMTGSRRTNNQGGRRGSAWYDVCFILFGDGHSESIPAARFFRTAYCAQCGKRAGRCVCGQSSV